VVDPRFFRKKGSFSLAELAAIGGCRIERGTPEILVHDVAPLETADRSCLTLFDGKAQYREMFKDTKAGVCIVPAEAIDLAPLHAALLVAHYPRRAYALIAQAFYPQDPSSGVIDATAVVHPTAKLGQGVAIGPMAVIGANVELGDFVEIGALAVIGESVVIGEKSIVGSHVSLSHALVGKNVQIKPGARIGQSGFGFFRDTGDMGGHVTVPQLARVIIHDHVEIGSNTTVDRGSWHDTVIGAGTRIDNLVQIGHNVQLGKGCVLCSQTGISGSTKMGDYVVAAGQVGIADNVTIGTGARLAAQCGIMSDVLPGETLMGSPAMPIKTHYRQVALLKRLEEERRTKIKEK